MNPRQKFIKSLLRQRLEAAGVFQEWRDEFDQMSESTVMGTPEATLVTLVEIYTVLRNSYGWADEAILAKMEKDRVSLGSPSGGLPTPLTLHHYVAYRLQLEHEAPLTEPFIADAIRQSLAYFVASGRTQPGHAPGYALGRWTARIFLWLPAILASGFLIYGLAVSSAVGRLILIAAWGLLTMDYWTVVWNPAVRPELLRCFHSSPCAPSSLRAGSPANSSRAGGWCSPASGASGGGSPDACVPVATRNKSGG